MTYVSNPFHLLLYQTIKYVSRNTNICDNFFNQFFQIIIFILSFFEADKALLLQQLSDKPNKSKGNNPTSANKETTKDINNEEEISSTNPNNTTTSSGGVAAATGTNGIDNKLPA